MELEFEKSDYTNVVKFGANSFIDEKLIYAKRNTKICIQIHNDVNLYIFKKIPSVAQAFVAKNVISVFFASYFATLQFVEKIRTPIFFSLLLLFNWFVRK